MTRTATVKTASGAPSWTSSNQAWLAVRFAAWRRALDADALGADCPPAEADDTEAEITPAAEAIAALFGLSTFERDLLVLTAGVELDRDLAEAVAGTQGQSAFVDGAISFSLALRLLDHAHWDALSPSRPLRHWSLLHVDETRPLLRAPMRIDERLLHYLTGVAAFDTRLDGVAWLEDASPEAASDDFAVRLARAAAGSEPSRRPLVVLTDALADGSRTRAARAAARAAFQQLSLRTMWVDPASMPQEPSAFAAIARRVDREAALARAGIALAVDGLEDQSSRRLLRALRSPVIALGQLDTRFGAVLEHRRVVRITVANAGCAVPRPFSGPVQDAVDRALQQFHVDFALVEQAVAGVDDGARGDAAADHVWQVLREAARGGLDALAQRIDSRATFDDLVAPPHVGTQLRQIAGQLRHRHTVHDRWGFAARSQRGLGLAALFSGESGTGKTLAAEAIANEVRLDLFRVDLAAVVSKYIGETEKNLSRLFDAAEQSGAVLLFDEADALFGKRSEVKDSHDRYANIDIAYLLQRVETYRGLAILTTNMRSALDRAFLRRIRFVVEFPFPDAAAREEIWRRELPSEAPLGDVDFRALGALRISGGSIRAIALNGAFMAADAAKPIDTAVLMDAAAREFAKLERLPQIGRGR